MKREDIPYSIIRKPSRRTATLSISHDNHLTITVPRSFPEAMIRQIIEHQSAWIRKKMRLHHELAEKFPPKRYQPGDLFAYLGENYMMEIVESQRRDVVLEDGKLRVFAAACEIQGESDETIVTIVRSWYEGKAHQILKERVLYYENRMKVRGGEIRVKMLESLWGSCAAAGHLSFNARLIMAPRDVVDYVVVHELAHLRHRNHSAGFWAEVERVIPDYKMRRRWLRKHGEFLRL